MDINEANGTAKAIAMMTAMSAADAIIEAHQGVLESHDIDWVEDTTEADDEGGTLHVVLNGASDRIDVDVDIDVDATTTVDDVVSAVRTGLNGINPAAEFNDMVRMNWLDDEPDPAGLLHDMEGDGEMFAETAIALNPDDIRGRIREGGREDKTEV